MEAIFQQAPFDDKNDRKRIEEVAKEVELKIRKLPGIGHGRCDRCGWHGIGFARVLDGQRICVKCLIKDEVERRFKEAK